ncbi:AraC family transcriptional regulator [Actinomycetospora termitidis]|uniref:AraC family transcriptional regulator n=1 Tax=Actinomycetospora termitidis TaxID=3053470 RepID=A0ABT7M460_9PSEU|nr:AraC family transcriptional regulator [Actinomycetospora sp. Odt1-22]MDL5155009.1 AraC family transcriptional regulator [Actinomycetospora sp. Odt1-22]
MDFRRVQGFDPEGMGSSTWSTGAVEQGEAFDYWRDLICDAFVQLSARPRGEGPFRGAIEHSALDEVELSLVDAAGQRVDRTRTLIARSHEDYLLASIQLDGRGTVHQAGRVAPLTAGSMAFYDSTRPYTLEFDDAFRQLVVQVPRSAIPGARVDGATAVPLDGSGAVRLVTDFFRGMVREHHAGRPTPGLAPHAVGLLEFALGLAAASASTPGAEAATRQLVRRAVARAAGTPGVTADDVAAACHLSRRTLFRVLAAEGSTLSELLRRERVARARTLLRSDPDLPVAAVAARCGFAGPAQFHRAFRAATGSSPGAYRTQDGTPGDPGRHASSPGGRPDGAPC